MGSEMRSIVGNQWDPDITAPRNASRTPCRYQLTWGRSLGSVTNGMTCAASRSSQKVTYLHWHATGDCKESTEHCISGRCTAALQPLCVSAQATSNSRTVNFARDTAYCLCGDDRADKNRATERRLSLEHVRKRQGQEMCTHGERRKHKEQGRDVLKQLLLNRTC